MPDIETDVGGGGAGHTPAVEDRFDLRNGLAAALFAATLATAGLPATAAADDACAPQVFEDAPYTVCVIDLRTHDLRLFWRDGQGMPYALLDRLPGEIDGMTLVAAMNAGMYDSRLAPIGLFVAGGETLRPASTSDGPGNFHLKPNGVFFVGPDGAAVMETERYLAGDRTPDLATQSGPMLVIDGEIHPRFLPHSTSRKRRNGVGVRDGDTVILAISEGLVTFREFARLFRDHLGTPDALFLDGTMSSLRAPALDRLDRRRPMGPMLAAYRRR